MSGGADGGGGGARATFAPVAVAASAAIRGGTAAPEASAAAAAAAPISIRRRGRLRRGGGGGARPHRRRGRLRRRRWRRHSGGARYAAASAAAAAAAATAAAAAAAGLGAGGAIFVQQGGSLTVAGSSGERQHGRGRRGAAAVAASAAAAGPLVLRLPAGRRRHAHLPAGRGADPDRVGRHRRRRPARAAAERRLVIQGRRHPDALGRQHLLRRHDRIGGRINFAAANNPAPARSRSTAAACNGRPAHRPTSPPACARRRRAAAPSTPTATTSRCPLPFGGSTGGIVKTGSGTLTLSARQRSLSAPPSTTARWRWRRDNISAPPGSDLALRRRHAPVRRRLSTGRAITLNAGGGTFDTNGNAATLSGDHLRHRRTGKDRRRRAHPFGCQRLFGPHHRQRRHVEGGCRPMSSAPTATSRSSAAHRSQQFQPEHRRVGRQRLRHPGLGDADDPCRHQRHLRQATSAVLAAA